jgi:folate-binding protein YgfZ
LSELPYPKKNLMTLADELRQVAAHGGLVDRSDRVRIELTGPDRAKFLHNLTTNEIKRLLPGRGCETFVTSLQGKTIGYLQVLIGEDRIWTRTDPQGMEIALPHFEKYGVFDDVAIDDRTSGTFEIHLLGPVAIEVVERAGGELPADQSFSHRETTIGGNTVRIVRESPGGLPGLTLIGPKSAAETVRAAVVEAGRELGLIELTPSAFEVLRIEAGTPVFGAEVTEKNLPQELDRDDRAISFVKGCYLGQETVARIDALGHVNQVLRGLRFDEGSLAPASGSPVEKDGKRVGVVTSAAFSALANRAVALAMVRTTHSAAGTTLTVVSADTAAPAVATVANLPMEA